MNNIPWINNANDFTNSFMFSSISTKGIFDWIVSKTEFPVSFMPLKSRFPRRLITSLISPTKLEIINARGTVKISRIKRAYR